MEPGDKVRAMGVYRSLRVECSDEKCERKHYDDHEQRSDVNGRYHYQDGPREHRPAIVKGFEPPVWPSKEPRVVLVDVHGNEISCDAADVEPGKKTDAHEMTWNAMEAIANG